MFWVVLLHIAFGVLFLFSSLGFSFRFGFLGLDLFCNFVAGCWLMDCWFLGFGFGSFCGYIWLLRDLRNLCLV